MRAITTAVLELSQSAYDEIERKLLEAGYEHIFERGPGSRIDLTGIGVERALFQKYDWLMKLPGEDECNCSDKAFEERLARERKP